MALQDEKSKTAPSIEPSAHGKERLATAFSGRNGLHGNSSPRGNLEIKGFSQGNSLDEPPNALNVNPAGVITKECVAITTALRRHVRWSKSSASYMIGSVFSQGSGPFQASHTAHGQRRSRTQVQKSGQELEDEEVDYEALALDWGLQASGTQNKQEDLLLPAFNHLRNNIRICPDLENFDLPTLFHPFIQVIRSSSTSASITSLALLSIAKFLAYDGLVNENSPRLDLAMQLLSAGITHCRFEATESAADETVLLQILNVMEYMLSSPGGHLLGDENICEIMETCLSICCQPRLSELLRQSAELSIMKMCQIVFQRLKFLEVDTAPIVGSPEASSIRPTDARMKPSSPESTPLISQSHPDGSLLSQSPNPPNDKNGLQLESSYRNTAASNSPEQASEASTVNDAAETATNPQPVELTAASPYSLPSIRELLRVLIELLNSQNQQQKDLTKAMALRTINVSLEIAGSSMIKHPSLATLVKGNLCKHLFQLIKSDNTRLLSESLKVAGTLFETCREGLKLQQELFLSYLVGCLHPQVPVPRDLGVDASLYEGISPGLKIEKPLPSRVSSGRSTPVPVKDRRRLGMEASSRRPEAREAMTECVTALLREPGYFTELFVNYDCEIDRSDLCEDLIGLMARNAFPDSAQWSTINVPPLCLDALLGYVSSIVGRLDKDSEDHNGERRTLQEQRNRKKIIIQGAAKFNDKPAAGVEFLASKGIITNTSNVQSVASMLRGTSRLSKAVLGDFVSKKSNEQLLQAFLELFDFSGKRVDEALRDLLNSFRLPGEAPLIERIVEQFSQRYCACNSSGDVVSADAVHVLAYAIIILNTDQHSPNLRDEKRMKYADFARNLRGVNAGGDFAPEYLQEIYESIKNYEIILPEEHNNQQAFDYAWEELLLKTRDSGRLNQRSTNIFDSDMFAATWRPIVATFMYVFMSATDARVCSAVVVGIVQCAQIAANYRLTDALDHIVTTLASISTLGSDTPPNTTLNTAVQVKGKSIVVSELAVRFGGNVKAKLATTILFRSVLPGRESDVAAGWKSVVRVWSNLFVNSLLPSISAQCDNQFDIAQIPLPTPSQTIERGERPSENGFLQSLSSLLSNYAAGDPPEPSDEELNKTLQTIECLKSCSFKTFFARTQNMSLQSTEYLANALLAQLPDDPSPVMLVVKPDGPSPVPKENINYRTPTERPVYDPLLVYVLEYAVILAQRDDQMAECLGPKVADALQNIVRNANQTHPAVLSRAVYYLLHILNTCQKFDFIRAPVVLHAISSFDDPHMKSSAVLIAKGFIVCIRDGGPLKSEIISTLDFWSILDKLRSIPDSQNIIFSLIEGLVGAKSSAITADNYESAIGLLDKFATSQQLSVVQQQPTKGQNRGPKHSKKAESSEREMIDRGVRAVSLIYRLTDRAPALIDQSHLKRSEAWITYWSPILQALRSQCENPNREIRQNAFSCLQGSLQSPDLTSEDHQEWTAIFGEILIPLIQRLLKPEIYQLDPAGMSELRIRASTLLCKIFLHYLVLLSQWDGMLDLWVQIMELLDRLVNSGQGTSLEEAVSESLKNILLVMADGGYLEAPAEGEKGSEMWEETWNRLDRSFPNLRMEVFPKNEPPPEPKSAPSTPEKADGK